MCNIFRNVPINEDSSPKSGNQSLVRMILEYLWLYSWIIDSVHSDKISFEVLVHFPNTLPKMKFRPDSYNISYSVYLQSLSLTERISSYLAIWDSSRTKLWEETMYSN